MEGMGKKPRRRRSFTAEFKAEIVELCQRGDRSVGQVAKDFNLTETAVREWLKQAERDTGTREDGGLTSQERRELAELRRENRRLREDVGMPRHPPATAGQLMQPSSRVLGCGRAATPNPILELLPMTTTVLLRDWLSSRVRPSPSRPGARSCRTRVGPPQRHAGTMTSFPPLGV